MAGKLTEAVTPEQDGMEKGMFECPAGPAKLRLLIVLPDGIGWFDVQIAAACVVCGGSVCLPLVEGKLDKMRVPGSKLP